MRISPRTRRAIRRVAAVLALTAIAYVALLFAPGPLFRYAYAEIDAFLLSKGSHPEPAWHWFGEKPRS
jgi:hypothetical protein